jgi:hypothetical protein
MPKRRSKFDWSKLDRQGLYEFFSSIAPKLTNQEITIAKFHRILASHIKSQLPVIVTKTTGAEVEFGWVYIGGTYYSDYDKEKKECLELVLMYNPFEESFTMPLRRFKRMCVNLADTLLHEIIHMRQYRRRKFKSLPDYDSNAEKTEQRQEQEYLGCSDEIDAYGFNIACELMGKFNNDHQSIIAYLNEQQKGLRRRHNSWRMYLKAFDHNHNHPIIKRVKTKVIRYLPYAELGKPYRNKDWINC